MIPEALIELIWSESKMRQQNQYRLQSRKNLTLITQNLDAVKFFSQSGQKGHTVSIVRTEPTNHCRMAEFDSIRENE